MISAGILSASAFIIDCRNKDMDRDFLIRQATLFILVAIYMQGGVNG
jgi:hypothetical protein